MNKYERVIKNLMNEQQSNGSFGRFHTMDSKLKQKIPTTQAAAWIMYENEITRENEVCNKTCLYMENLLNDISQWPDSWEVNKWFKPAVPLYVASSLALFGSNNNSYKEVCTKWIDILISAFAKDMYSLNAINTKSKELLGVEIDGSYIGVHGLNNLTLFAFNVDKIPSTIQRLYIQWLHNYNGVISYTNIRPDSLSKNSESARVISLLSKFTGFDEEFPNLAK